MLGGYEVVRQLSEGASAEVFLVRPPQTQEHAIIEVLRPELFRESELTTRFLNEARVRKALSHPNVAKRVSEGTTPDGRPYLVSEAVGDSLLDQLRAHGPLQPDAVIKMMIPLCDALQYLHARGMVHGNIKPAVVYLGAEGQPQKPKLVDYGLAFFRPGRTMPRPAGRVLVEAEYLSPERIRGQRAGAASDIYALGVLMYEALTGTPPFVGDAVDVKHQHLTALPPALPAHAAKLQPILEGCLVKDPKLRFTSAHALRDALADQLEGTLPLGPPVSEDADVLPAKGDVVGRYTLIEPIGEGAMGRVFLARHSRLGRVVALKVLKPEHAQNHDQVERFVREARSVNRIRNEHIVEIFDLVDEQLSPGSRRVYCVMELLKGWTLGELLSRGPVTLSRALPVMQQVALALDAAHRAGVVHRDVKPDNIFITQRHGVDFAKVVDFGVAKLREHPDPESGQGVLPDLLGHTAAGTVVGTPAYMAPEQVSGKPSDHRVDVYAFGTVLYRLASGRNPFSAPNFEELAKKILREQPAPLPDRAPSGELVPPGLRTLVRDCLQKEPGMRPPSMSEVAARLSPIIDWAKVPEIAPMEAEPELPGRATDRRWVAVVASGLLLASALLTFGALRLRGEREVAAPGVVVSPQPQPQVLAQKVTVQFASDPEGATLTRVDTGEVLGRTPLTVTAPRSDAVAVVRFSLDRFESTDVQVPLNQDAAVKVMLRPTAAPKAR